MPYNIAHMNNHTPIASPPISQMNNHTPTTVPPIMLGYCLAGLTLLGMLAALGALIPVTVLLLKSLRDSKIPVEFFLLNYCITIYLQLVKMAAFNLPTQVAGNWILGQVTCVVAGFIEATLRYSTLSQVAVLVFDRFICLRYIKHYEDILTRERVVAGMLLPWIFGAYNAAVHTTIPDGIAYIQGRYSCDISGGGGATSPLIQSGSSLGIYIFVVTLMVIALKYPVFNGKNAITARKAVARRQTVKNQRLDGHLIVTRLVLLIVLTCLPVDLVTLCLALVGDGATLKWPFWEAIFCLQAVSIFVSPFLFYITGEKIRTTVLVWLHCRPPSQPPKCTFKCINHGRIILRDGGLTLKENNNNDEGVTQSDIEMSEGNDRFWRESSQCLNSNLSPVKETPDTATSSKGNCQNSFQGPPSEVKNRSISIGSTGSYEISLCTAVSQETKEQPSGLFDPEIQRLPFGKKIKQGLHRRLHSVGGGLGMKLSDQEQNTKNRGRMRSHSVVKRLLRKSIDHRQISGKSSGGTKSTNSLSSVTETRRNRIALLKSAIGEIGEGDVEFAGEVSDAMSLLSNPSVAGTQRPQMKALTSTFLHPNSSFGRGWAISPGYLSTAARVRRVSSSSNSYSSDEENVSLDFSEAHESVFRAQANRRVSHITPRSPRSPRNLPRFTFPSGNTLQPPKPLHRALSPRMGRRSPRMGCRSPRMGCRSPNRSRANTTRRKISKYSNRSQRRSDLDATSLSMEESDIFILESGEVDTFGKSSEKEEPSIRQGNPPPPPKGALACDPPKIYLNETPFSSIEPGVNDHTTSHLRQTRPGSPPSRPTVDDSPHILANMSPIGAGKSAMKPKYDWSYSTRGRGVLSPIDRNRQRLPGQKKSLEVSSLDRQGTNGQNVIFSRYLNGKNEVQPKKCSK